MAQAARLNVRMQKELKLLLADPPPGASFPLLSPHSDLSSFSLSTIHAQIEGPEGTVYEKGIFKISIQIPERYPFQPPIVTFSTPIYHPNIDNGGRICLDILNLPPKGAWQPSLNISAVTMSIGLLLCEPNPDDGLMCEASREYKYNRQAFDQKARSLTEKYARSGASENDSGLQSHSNPSTIEAKGSDLAKSDANEDFASCKKLSGISRKLSAESSGSNLRDSDKGVNEVPSPLLDNQLQVQGPKQKSKDMSNDYSQNNKNLLGPRRKLALGFMGPTHIRICDEKDNVVPHQGTSPLNPHSLSLGSSESLLVLQSSKHHDQQPHHDQDFKSIVSSTKKLCCVGQKRPHESFNPCQRSNDCEKNLNTIPQKSPYGYDSNVSQGKLPLPTARNRIEIEPRKDSVDRTRIGFTNPKRKKLGLSGKKPSFGFLGLPLSREKENMGPHRSTVLKASSMPSKKMPPEPLEQLEGENECNLQLHIHSENLTKTPSKSLAVGQECRYDVKQPQDHGGRFAERIKENGEELSILPESVIVLDSEDSEEERKSVLRVKLSVARNCLPGNWKAKR